MLYTQKPEAVAHECSELEGVTKGLRVYKIHRLHAAHTYEEVCGSLPIYRVFRTLQFHIEMRMRIAYENT